MENKIIEPGIRVADPRDMEYNVTSILIDRDGREIERHVNHNTVTTVGKAALANLGGGLASQTAWTKMGLGSSASAPSAGDTDLNSRITATGMAQTTAGTISVSTSTLTLDHTWINGSGGNVTVQEVGVFNSTTGVYANGVMLAHSLTNSHVVGDGQSLRIVYNIPIA